MLPIPGTGKVERGEILIAQGQGRGGDVLFQVGDLAGAGDGQHHRAALEHPGQGDLARRGA